MDDGPELTLPEELLLLCASPSTGVLERPRYFTRVLAGGVLAELELHGAITVGGGCIDEVTPVELLDPIMERALARIVLDVRLGRPGARQTRLVGLPTDYDGVPGQAPTTGWGRRVARARVVMRAAGAGTQPPRELRSWMGYAEFHDLDRRYAEALERRGMLVADRRRALGIVPVTRWTVSSYDPLRRVADRIDLELRPHLYGRPPVPPSLRTVHLMALAGVAGLVGHLYPLRDHPDLRRYIERLTAGHALAHAAYELIKSDEERDS
ncbi:GPP34 family phosphoprotein [Sphaerisporangium sp. NPDC051011]|uniref:GPP34 family phosphoprotein n=1 Tax=Sphaerisporangium sp. NPDC051011 TaxID=3155792 RepID=UPI0033C5BCCC